MPTFAQGMQPSFFSPTPCSGDNAITAFSIARQCGIVPRDTPLPSSLGGGSAAWKQQALEYLATQEGRAAGAGCRETIVMCSEMLSLAAVCKHQFR